MTINEAIDSRLKELDQTSAAEHDPTKGFYISGLGLCLKGAYYQRLGAKEPYSANKLRIFKLGNVLEDQVYDLLASKYVVDTQVRVEYPEFDLRGKADFVLYTPEGPKLVEMKTMNSNGFRTMVGKQEGPKLHHAIQVGLYWNKLRQENMYGPNLTASVLYVNKDTFEMYEANLTPEQLDAAVKIGLHRAEVLKKAWDSKTPPEIEEEAWVANYCGVHTYCNKLQTL